MKHPSWESRLINLTIDVIVIYFLSLFLEAVFVYVFILDENVTSVEYTNYNLPFFATFFTYYLFMEYFFSRTIGKMITNTRVFNYDYEKPNFKQILIRTLVRLTFVEAISYLKPEPDGLHDSLSSTVVKKV